MNEPEHISTAIIYDLLNPENLDFRRLVTEESVAHLGHTCSQRQPVAQTGIAKGLAFPSGRRWIPCRKETDYSRILEVPAGDRPSHFSLRPAARR